MMVERGAPHPLAGVGPDDSAGRSGSAGSLPIRPGLFCQYLLKAHQAAESKTRRRKRDQAPDRIGLGIKRDLLQQAIADDPAPEAFEGWLMEQIARARHAGSVRAMCEQVFLDFQMAAHQPELAAWLAAGAPSDDAEPEPAGRDRDRAGERERWQSADDPRIACTCHLPQR